MKKPEESEEKNRRWVQQRVHGKVLTPSKINGHIASIKENKTGQYSPLMSLSLANEEFKFVR